MKKFLALALAVLMLAGCCAVFASCGGDSDTIKIGLSGPLTGPAATYGEAVEKSALLAIEEINANGGLKNGVKLENVDASKSYSFELNEYGQYTVEYTAKEVDWFGGEKKFVNYVIVMDEVAPKIRLTSDYTKSVKVGEAIILPNFEVSDNLNKAEELTVDKLILNPVGRTERLPGSSNSLIAAQAGFYRITIMVKDAYGNMATVHLGVEVTE